MTKKGAEEMSDTALAGSGKRRKRKAMTVQEAFESPAFKRAMARWEKRFRQQINAALDSTQLTAKDFAVYIGPMRKVRR